MLQEQVQQEARANASPIAMDILYQLDTDHTAFRTIPTASFARTAASSFQNQWPRPR